MLSRASLRPFFIILSLLWEEQKRHNPPPARMNGSTAASFSVRSFYASLRPKDALPKECLLLLHSNRIIEWQYSPFAIFTMDPYRIRATAERLKRLPEGAVAGCWWCADICSTVFMNSYRRALLTLQCFANRWSDFYHLTILFCAGHFIRCIEN